MYTIRKRGDLFYIYYRGAMTVYWFRSRKSARRFMVTLQTTSN